MGLSLLEPVSLGVVSLKGGVGKTILAVHLAHYLQEQQRPVVLVDAEAVHGSVNWDLRGERFSFPVLSIEDYLPQEWVGHWQVFDTPAHPSNEFLRDLLEIIDQALVPVTINLDAQIAAEELVSYFKKLGVPSRTVVNDAPTRPQQDGDILRTYLTEQLLDPCQTIVRHRKAFEYARHEGVPVYACSHRTRMQAWNEIMNLGEELYGGT